MKPQTPFRRRAEKIAKALCLPKSLVKAVAKIDRLLTPPKGKR